MFANSNVRHLRTPNVITSPTIRHKDDTLPKYLGSKPVGKFPSGTVPAVKIKVDMAVGMYQFHDLLSSHIDPITLKGLKDTNGEINDNTIGLLNQG